MGKPAIESAWIRDKAPRSGQQVYFLRRGVVLQGQYQGAGRGLDCFFVDGVTYWRDETNGWLPYGETVPFVNAGARVGNETSLEVFLRDGSELDIPEKKTNGACAVDFYIDLNAGWELILPVSSWGLKRSHFTLADEPVTCRRRLPVYSPIVNPGETVRVNLGCRVQFDPGAFLLLAVRSKISAYGLTLTNAVGLIDSDYRGFLMATIRNDSDTNWKMQDGDRLIQGALIQQGQWKPVAGESLQETERGEGGFGHTGA